MAQRSHVAPGENEWSAVQILGHMVEIVPYWLNHCYKIIAAAGEPPYFGRPLDAPERLAADQRPETEEPGELLLLLNDEVRPAGKAIRQMRTALET